METSSKIRSNKNNKQIFLNITLLQKKTVIALTQHAYIKPKGFSGKNTVTISYIT